MTTKSSGPTGAPLKFPLDRVAVHKKFMNEGKASIQFLNENCTAMLSNAPLASLAAFLRLLMVKITGATAKPLLGAKERLMQMEKGQQFDEISPVTNVELDRIRKSSQSKSSDTTPSPPGNKKRPRTIGKGAEESPRGAKLFKPSRLIEEPQALNEEQKEILTACLGGRNIFFTGKRGRDFVNNQSGLRILNLNFNLVGFGIWNSAYSETSFHLIIINSTFPTIVPLNSLNSPLK